MTNGLTVKEDSFLVTYDIHFNGTACSGFSNSKDGPKEAIYHLFQYFLENQTEWAADIYKKYSSGHKVIAPMLLVEWTDDR